MEHLPVLFNEALEQLQVQDHGIYVDCTFGRGGHSAGILKRLNTQGRLIAFDRDLDAIHSDNAKLLSQDARFKLIHAPFSELEHTIKQEQLFGKINGLLIDLGVSSPQLDNPERGFSFMRDGVLDMRMNTTAGLSAAEWLAKVDEKQLVQVLFDYGEEKFARRIAKAIITTRAITPITSTRQLAEIIENAVPVREKHKHPATRTFQAIRIEINQELEQLKSVLQQSLNVLASGGRLVVISFHSLEDRIVKRFIKQHSNISDSFGKLPIKQADIPKGVLKKLGKFTASDQELNENPRARSAIMRVAERV